MDFEFSFRKFLFLRILEIHFLHESTNFEMRNGDKICNFFPLYISRKQNLEGLETSSDNLDLKLYAIAKSNPFSIVLLGDLNAE